MHSAVWEENQLTIPVNAMNSALVKKHPSNPALSNQTPWSFYEQFDVFNRSCSFAMCCIFSARTHSSTGILSFTRLGRLILYSGLQHDILVEWMVSRYRNFKLPTYPKKHCQSSFNTRAKRKNWMHTKLNHYFFFCKINSLHTLLVMKSCWTLIITFVLEGWRIYIKLIKCWPDILENLHCRLKADNGISDDK